jgi:hypothetical protein
MCRKRQAAIALPLSRTGDHDRGDKMGVMSRNRGEVFVITSDRSPTDNPNKRAPNNLSSTYLVWTGDSWSSVMTDAQTFETEEAADNYIRANSERVMKHG